MTVQFHDNSVQVKAALDSAAKAFLYEAAGELEAAAKRNSRVDSGQLKNSWDYEVDDDKATIGSPLENAIWEEFGTGEYALQGNGRKGGWVYHNDRRDSFYFTRGKKPQRGFYRAFTSLKPKLIKRAGEILKGKTT